MGGEPGEGGPHTAGAWSREPGLGMLACCASLELAECLALPGLWIQAGGLGQPSQGLRGSKSVVRAPHQSSPGPPRGSQARPVGVAAGGCLWSVNYVLSTLCWVPPKQTTQGMIILPI